MLFNGSAGRFCSRIVRENIPLLYDGATLLDFEEIETISPNFLWLLCIFSCFFIIQSTNKRDNLLLFYFILFAGLICGNASSETIYFILGSQIWIFHFWDFLKIISDYYLSKT